MVKRKQAEIHLNSSKCLFLKVPSRIFGEKILQLLSIEDIMILDSAITNQSLRKSWWLANEKKPIAYAEQVLRYAIDDKVGLSFYRKNQVKIAIKKGLRSSHLCFDLSDLYTYDKKST